MEEEDNVADSQRVSGETKTVTKPSKKRKKKKTEDPEGKVTFVFVHQFYYL